MIPRSAPLLLLGGALVAMPAHAQSPIRMEAGVTSMRFRTEGEVSSTGATATGTPLGGMIRLGAGRFDLTGRYLEGDLEAESGGGVISVVQGSATLSYRLFSWLKVEAATRTLNIDADGSERWTTRGGGLRFDLPVYDPVVIAHLSVLQGFTTKVNFPTSRPFARSGEVGVRYAGPRGRLWLDLSLVVDRLEAGPADTRTLGALAFTMGIRAP